MRTPKIESLHRLIDWLNARSGENLKMSKLGLDHSSLGNNPWLTGFLEADGNFFCGFGLNSEGIAEAVKSYMRISQKQMYKITSDIPKENNSNFQIMEKIREFLDVKTLMKLKESRINMLNYLMRLEQLKKLLVIF